MIYLQSNSLKAAYHFATEEHIMQTLKPDQPVLMLWQTENTVMIGANQIVGLEIDQSYAKAQGIAIVRRSSGGGTIFTDQGTLLYTIIQAVNEGTDPKDVISLHLASPVIDALGKLGVEAALKGRNDILIAGKKISGIAQYLKHGYLCSHGSLLFDANLEELARVLTVDDEKIASKALRSIKSRVTNINEHCTKVPIDEFRQELLTAWQRQGELGIYHFTKEDEAGIQAIRTTRYENPLWTFNHTPPYTITNAHRFPGGRIEVFLNVQEGQIKACCFTGDFLAVCPLDELEERLIGLNYKEDTIRGVLTSIDLKPYLGTLTLEDLISVLFAS